MKQRSLTTQRSLPTRQQASDLPGKLASVSTDNQSRLASFRPRRRGDRMMRRRVLALGIGATVAASLPARAQPQPAMPVIGFLNTASADVAGVLPAFHDGLKEHGYAEG